MYLHYVDRLSCIDVDECNAESANCDLNATLTLMVSAIVFVTLVALEMKLHVVMQAPVAETVIVTSLPVARGPLVLSYAHVMMIPLEMVLPAVT